MLFILDRKNVVRRIGSRKGGFFVIVFKLFVWAGICFNLKSK